MPTVPAASVADLALGLALGAVEPGVGNRFSLEGLASRRRDDGTLEISLKKAEATALRVASGPFVLELDRIALNEVVALVRFDAGRPRLRSVEAANATLSGARVQGPLVLPELPRAADTAAPSGTWSLGPLGTAEGTVRAEIVDAHLLFDADVTIPIRQGQIDFGDATVEHVGPDSRMGASRLGLYVDAPNGRSYLYQFASVPVAGVEFERRGAMLGPWVTHRGSLRLQPFVEGLLREPRHGAGPGFTDQARLLFDRTAVSGEVRLGDAGFAAPGLQAELVGRSEGRNTVRLHSDAVGRGLALDIAALSVRNAVLGAGRLQLRCGEATGVLKLQLLVDGKELRFVFDCAELRMSGLHGAAAPPPAG